MRLQSREIFWRSVVRAVIASAVVVPLGALYIAALVSLNNEQVILLVKTLLWLPPLLLGIDFFIFRLNLAPVINALRKVRAGETVESAESIRAQKRAFIFPYLNIFYSVFWFSLGGVILSWILVEWGGLSFREAVYVVAAAVTCGFLTAIIVFYTLRKPVRDVVRELIGHGETYEDKQPFFVPLSANLTFSYLLLIALMLVFMGLLSFVMLQKSVDGQVGALRQSHLSDLKTVIDRADFNAAALPALLEGLGGNDSVFCLIDNEENFQGCRGKTISAGAIDKIESLKAQEVVEDRETGWSWSWITPPGINARILSGLRKKSSMAAKSDLKLYYVRAAVVVMLLAVGISLLIAFDISRPIKDLTNVAVEVAEGKMELEARSGNEDETGIMARAFNKMTGLLIARLHRELERSRGMVSSIGSAVQTLGPMSKQLVSVAGEQASGSVQQATAAEEAATTSQEIATVSKQIAENAQKVTKAAEGALSTAQKGQDRLQDTLSKFEDIKKKMDNIASAVMKLGDQSQEIGEIIKMIDEITEQTNLLALNASIEAVGAGEQGKRFGVVAQEIRRLANNSSQSTGKIQDIINRMQNSVSSSVMHAEEGDKAVNEGRQAMEEMATLFKEVLDSSNNATPRLKEINMMTSQQASASDQMANTINEVKDSAQQVSASANELQASVSELEHIVSQLEQHVEEEEASDKS